MVVEDEVVEEEEPLAADMVSGSERGGGDQGLKGGVQGMKEESSRKSLSLMSSAVADVLSFAQEEAMRR